MAATIHFRGPLRYRLRSAATVCRSLVETSVRPTSKGSRQPGCNWLFEAGTEILKSQLAVAFEMRDVYEARRYLDSFDILSGHSDVSTTPVTHELFRGSWFAANNADTDVTVLYFHGGGYSFYPRSYAHLIRQVTLGAKSRTFALDYRLAPDYRFPAQLEDAVNAYRWLLANGTQPENLVFIGDSAGANLALAALLALRDTKLPLPALAIALSPPTDFETRPADFVHEGSSDWINWQMLEQWRDWFCDAVQRSNPLVSPARADLRGLPPIYIQAGCAEILYDSIQSFADRARNQGADVVLDSWDYMNHDFQMFAPYVPQSVEALRRLGEVVARRTRDAQHSKPVFAMGFD